MRKQIMKTARLVLFLFVVISVLCFIVFAVGPKAYAGPYIFETIFSYKCENLDYNSTKLKCGQDKKQLVLVYSKTKDAKVAKYRDYIAADIIKNFKAAGGVTFKMIKEGDSNYKLCSFFKNSWDFNCANKKPK